MRRIEVTRKSWERRDRHHQAEQFAGINESVLLVDAETQKPIAAQILLGDKLLQEQRELARWLRFALKWDDAGVAKSKQATGNARLSGMRYPSKVFGFTEPKPLRRRYAASASALTRDFPRVRDILDTITVENWQMFSDFAPEEAAAHEALVRSKVNEDWFIAGKAWTSGIINNTAALPYHKDTGNIPTTWSAMLCLRGHVEGGGLHLPEYDVTFGIPNGSVTFFDGQNTWHGVTPLVHTRNDAYRFTLVWYTKNGFTKIGSAAEEMNAAKRRATK